MASEVVWPQWRGNAKSEDATRCKYVTKNAQLGDGCFSVVKECMNIYTRDRYAMKLISKKTVQGKLWLIQREVKLLKEVSGRIRDLEHSGTQCKDTFEGHHHVLQLFDYFETPQHIVLVTQLCDHGDLYDKIIEAGSLDLSKQVKPYAACLLSAIHFLHSNGVVHRDVKAENIIFRLRISELDEFARRGSHYDHTSHDVVLADFGLATKLDSGDEELKECVGTISYLAPEVVKCNNIARMAPSESRKIPAYGELIDIWALGVLTYFMMTGYMPFDCDTDDETRKCITEGDFYVEDSLRDDEQPHNAHFWNFIHLCFNVSASERPSAHNLRKHPFVQEFFHDDDDSEPFGDKIALRKSTSSSSIHNLGTPSRSSSVSNIAHLGRNDSIPEMMRSGSRDYDLNKIRETLKKTLSMASLTLPRAGSVSKASQNKENSTFKLEPAPPTQSLMNGCFSLTPESKSNFTTSPCVSRNPSSNDVTRLMSATDSNSTSLTGRSTAPGRELTSESFKASNAHPNNPIKTDIRAQFDL
ncbi:LANO_0C08614g1_1 [Lachancea nothofagi CBS 11611]|uniref:LANO_0C08614g1_1 n=1 Tax=Lachancea nothofagi CBS 11611 TaxID=1266666 RepID=A0A1G4J9E8_9SACH|nr:LANO_0C08614g1_1 [Lachancea nothofagi CBS 11611]